MSATAWKPTTEGSAHWHKGVRQCAKTSGIYCYRTNKRHSESQGCSTRQLKLHVNTVFAWAGARHHQCTDAGRRELNESHSQQLNSTGRERGRTICSAFGLPGPRTPDQLCPVLVWCWHRTWRLRRRHMQLRLLASVVDEGREYCMRLCSVSWLHGIVTWQLPTIQRNWLMESARTKAVIGQMRGP